MVVGLKTRAKVLGDEVEDIKVDKREEEEEWNNRWRVVGEGEEQIEEEKGKTISWKMTW